MPALTRRHQLSRPYRRDTIVAAYGHAVTIGDMLFVQVDDGCCRAATKAPFQKGVNGREARVGDTQRILGTSGRRFTLTVAIPLGTNGRSMSELAEDRGIAPTADGNPSAGKGVIGAPYLEQRRTGT